MEGNIPKSFKEYLRLLRKEEGQEQAPPSELIRTTNSEEQSLFRPYDIFPSSSSTYSGTSFLSPQKNDNPPQFPSPPWSTPILSPPSYSNNTQLSQFSHPSSLTSPPPYISKHTQYQPHKSPPSSPTMISSQQPSTSRNPSTPKSKKRTLLPSLSPSLSPAKRKKTVNSPSSKKGNRWSDDETMIFLEVYKKWEKKMRTKTKKKALWELMQKQYVIMCKKSGITSTRDIRQLQDRQRYLVKEYKRVKDNNKASGRGREDFKFYDQVDQIIGQRESVNPTDTLDGRDNDSYPEPELENEDGVVDNEEANENEEPSDSENENVERNEKRKKTTNSRKEIINLIGKMQETMDKQTKIADEQNKSDKDFMTQFLAAQERSSQRQENLIDAILQMLRN